jgi:hypothetical protein
MPVSDYRYRCEPFTGMRVKMVLHSRETSTRLTYLGSSHQTLLAKGARTACNSAIGSINRDLDGDRLDKSAAHERACQDYRRASPLSYLHLKLVLPSRPGNPTSSEQREKIVSHTKSIKFKQVAIHALLIKSCILIEHPTSSSLLTRCSSTNCRQYAPCRRQLRPVR